MKKTFVYFLLLVFAFTAGSQSYLNSNHRSDPDVLIWKNSNNESITIEWRLIERLRNLFAQDELPDWSQMSPEKDGYEGTRTLELYDYIKANNIADPKPVVVAVMDSGFEIDHPDLAPNVWNNETEVNGQAGVDDDNNGYVDDFHGWNFLGKAVNLNMEVTREYARLKKAGTPETDEYFIKVKQEYDSKKSDDEKTSGMIKGIVATMKPAYDKLKAANITTDPKELKKIYDTLSDENKKAADEILGIYNMAGVGPEEVFEAETMYVNKIKDLYTLEAEPSLVIGDNPDVYDEKGYGDNDVTVKVSSHGTHVAGTIGAIKKGIGQAPFVKLMFIRVVPADGDERDKDVANGIRYAVDNGASIINLSAGKYFANNAQYVIDAIKYAESKGVLFVAAAGNEGTDISKKLNYPPKFYKEGGETKYFSNLLCVGANTWVKKWDSAKDPDNALRKYDLAASFSNYSDIVVDVFAPGVQVNSTVPDKKYAKMGGTSMASPNAAGVAAILKGYFPNLTAAQLKEIIMKSSRRYDGLEVKSKELKLVEFSKLSKTGGVVDAYNAFMLAKTY